MWLRLVQEGKEESGKSSVLLSGESESLAKGCNFSVLDLHVNLRFYTFNCVYAYMYLNVCIDACIYTHKYTYAFCLHAAVRCDIERVV